MDAREEQFRRRLLATFQVEANEHIAAMSSGLVELERGGDFAVRTAIVESVFRAAHSLKGAARAVNAAAIESLCQSAESVLSALKRNALALSPALLDLLHEAVDALGRLLGEVAGASSPAQAPRISELLHRLEDAARNPGLPPPAPAAGDAQPLPVPEPREATRAPEERAPAVQTVRIPAARLDALLRQAEEMVSAKLAAGERAAQIGQALAAVAALRRRQARIAWPRAKERRNADRTAQERERLGPLEASLQSIAKAASEDHRALAAMVDGLLADIKKVLMLPISTALELFPKIVRDLARDQGKDVALVLGGGDTEVDRRILEEMRDPLIHLLRNSVDHGIESPQERTRKGKPARGTVTLAVAPKAGGHLEIVVADDGAGIDVGKLRTAAANAGVSVPSSDEAALLRLVFESGVSTSPMITDLSGRGLGLAIVAEKVERLTGAIAVESRRDSGTTFRITLPVTLATFRGVHIRVHGQRYVLPTAHVRQVARVKRESIRMVENRATIGWNGSAISLVHLADVLGIPGVPAAGGSIEVLILGAGDRRVAFAVDEIMGEHEVLVKSLGRMLPHVRNIAGATVLASGKSVPILHVPDLLRSAVDAAGTAFAAPGGASPPDAAPKSVLVAEDSVTSRALLKNILESAGLRVVTAVDGLDALERLKAEPFALLVSDVEMPRMNGFDLTARIRADTALGALPVVLVTALGSREDRERGAEAGANAYIVKSSFDQGNLLEAVRRLI